MLSAFTARSIVELKQRDKSKIEALLAYGDRLLVGLNTGSLRIYRVLESIGDSGSAASSSEPKPSSGTSKPVELLREQEKFSKYKIEQLAIIKEVNILVSLSNGYVSTHDLQTYELLETLQKTKGASTFAVTSNVVKDVATGVPSIVSRLAVAVKRRLLLWSWHDSELSSTTSELTLVTGIKTLTWATGTKLVVGLSSSYVLVDVETAAITDIVGPGSIGGAPGQDGGRFGGVGVASMGYMGIGGVVPKPLATRLSEGQLLLAKDINSLFIDSDGNSLGRRQIPWSVAPEAIGYSYPFLLALQATKGTLEVRNPETLTMLQSISLANANQLHVPQPYVSLAHAGKGFLVSSERCIWRMDALGYDAQIDALVGRRRLDEAISLIGMLEDALIKDKEGRLREIKMLKAQDLFDQKKYRDSLDLFTEVSAPPERVISLYPAIIAGDPSPLESSQEGGDEASMETQRGNGSGELSVPSTEADTEEVTEQAERSAVHMHESVKSVDNITERDSPRASTFAASETASIAGRPSMSDIPRHELEGKDLETATSELAGFLVGARTKLQRFLNPDGTLKEVASDASIGSKGTGIEDLLVTSHKGHDPGREQRLRETAKLVDTTLFRSYMLVRPSMAGPLFRLPNFCDASVVNEKLLQTGRYNDLVDFFFGKRLHREALDLLKNFGLETEDGKAPPYLQGPQRTVAYLQNLPPELIDLILEYAEWPIRANPELGMEIFLADTENSETLPRLRVLNFLQKIDQKLAVKYLEHIIEELNDTTPDFHQRLIDDYLAGLKSQDPAGHVKKSEYKEKLLNFLRTSQHYDSWKVIQQLPGDVPDLYEARAIVLGQMREHRQALLIYVFKLKDPEKAENYCNQIYLTETSPTSSPAKSRRKSVTNDDDGPPSIYHSLLSLYMSPPSPYEPQWGPALEILAKHGSRLPASSTLALIPEVLPIQKLESYFRARIRSANTVVNDTRMVASLRKTVEIGEEAKLYLGDRKAGGNAGRNRHVVITEERVCGVCHKRFGGSAIKVMPNNAVVHYGCAIR
ncbi:Vacuolar morphogenesis protein 6 [Xylographa opegraphella]|nr:Vacuolar morphogenesis protein 6 [Xylographa opegraphella]